MSSAAVDGSASPALRKVAFTVGGMTCAACAARVQKKLNAIDDVSATVNFATGRALITAPESVPVSQLVDAVVQAGYQAEVPAAPQLADEEPAEAEARRDEARVRDLRKRLIVALVFFIPLSDLSVLWSLFPWSRFPGWQWILVVVAAPVVIWSAWPFHAAALRSARHGTASMDTLVSLGITAACCWSAYAMFVLDRDQAGLSARQMLLHASGGGIYLEVAASVTTFLLAGPLVRGSRTPGRRERDAGTGRSWRPGRMRPGGRWY